MKTLSIGLVLVLGAAAVAEAQSYGGASYGGYGPLTLRATTPAESFARGIADLVRSGGQASLWTSEAALNVAEARRYEMANRQQFIETYYAVRRMVRQYQAAELGPRMSPEDIARYARAAGPQRLSPGQFSPITGGVSWPILLRTEAFAGYRASLEGLFAHRAAAGEISTGDYLRIRQMTAAMKGELKQHVRRLPPGDYVLAKRFLNGLAYEAEQPVALGPELAQWR